MDNSWFSISIYSMICLSSDLCLSNSLLIGKYSDFLLVLVYHQVHRLVFTGVHLMTFESYFHVGTLDLLGIVAEPNCRNRKVVVPNGWVQTQYEQSVWLAFQWGLQDFGQSTISVGNVLSFSCFAIDDLSKKKQTLVYMFAFVYSLIVLIRGFRSQLLAAAVFQTDYS